MYLSGVGLKENSGKLVDVERRVLGKRRLVESHLLTSLVRGDWLKCFSSKFTTQTCNVRM